MKRRSGEMIKSAKKNSVNGSGVDKFDGFWHMFYNKGCVWNKSHTTGFNGYYKSNP